MKTLAAIPALNQEMKVPAVVLLSKKHVDSVLVIDDGSSDRTAEVAESAGATILRHEKNKGYGGALQSCFQFALDNGFDAMVILDSDGQHDPDEIPKVLSPLLDKTADITIGSRFLDKTENVPFYRKVGIDIITKLTNGASGQDIDITDSQSGFRGYSRKAIEGLKLKEMNMGASVEILLESGKLGLKIVEVPISIKYDEDSSTQNPVKHGLRVVGSIVRYVEFDHPLLLFGASGAIFIIISAITGTWSYYNYTQSNYLPFGPTILAVISLVTGMLLGVTGLILHAVINAQRRMWGK